jgi:hypothetical protein
MGRPSLSSPPAQARDNPTAPPNANPTVTTPPALPPLSRQLHVLYAHRLLDICLAERLAPSPLRSQPGVVVISRPGSRRPIPTRHKGEPVPPARALGNPQTGAPAITATSPTTQTPQRRRPVGTMKVRAQCAWPGVLKLTRLASSTSTYAPSMR